MSELRPTGSKAVCEFVLDVLRHDIEQVPNIRTMLNSTGSIGWRLNWPHDFTDAEITAALKDLASRGLVAVLTWDETRAHIQNRESLPDLDSAWDDCWFELTDLGRKHLETWIPPERAGYDELP